MGVMPADLGAMLATMAAIKRERRMEKARLDSLVVQVARDITDERVAIIRRNERYEPEGGYGHE